MRVNIYLWSWTGCNCKGFKLQLQQRMGLQKFTLMWEVVFHCVDTSTNAWECTQEQSTWLMWVRLWILSSSQVKGNCHQVTVSFHLIKPYFSFNDVSQDLHYDGSVKTLKKITGRDDSVQNPGSHIIQWDLWQIPCLFSNSLCIK